MKKLLLLIFAVIFTLLLVGCSILDLLSGQSTAYSAEYVILEVTDSTLLIADIDSDGNASEWSRYTAKNLFYPTYEIAVGDTVTIKHNGQILESYPMQFSKVYSMTYHCSETGEDITVRTD